jgi:hypothetical protein
VPVDFATASVHFWRMSTNDYILQARDKDLRLTLNEREACALLGMSKSKLYGLWKTKAVASYLDGRRRRFVTGSLYAWILEKVE